MIKTLQSLRLVFAIMILLHHFPYNGEGLFAAGGPLGVCFFIMLSGFAMSAGYGERILSGNFDFGKYFIKRLIKLWPLHLLCLAGIIAMTLPGCISSPEQIGILGINALMLQSWIPIKEVYFSGNAVSWCLCDLMFCYLTFPLLYRLIARLRLRSLGIVGLLAVAFYAAAIRFVPDDKVHAFIYISPIFRLLDFAIGIAAFRIYKRLNDGKAGMNLRNSSKFAQTCIELFIVALFVGSILIYPAIAERYSLSVMWWPVIFIAIITFPLLEACGGGYLSQLLQNRLLLKCSTASFTFYMIHHIVMTVVLKLMGMANADIPYHIELAVCLFAVMFTALIVYNYFEKPVSAYLSKKI